MKRITTFVLAVVLAVFTIPTAFGSQPTVENFHIDFDQNNTLVVFNSCPAGENGFFMKGFLDWRVLNILPQGDKLIVTTHFIIKASGHGLTSGRPMEVSVVENYSSVGDVDGYQYSSVGKFVITSPTGGILYRGKFNYQVSWDAEKQVFKLHPPTNFTAICR
jgi:hypothetical protein